MFAGQSSAPVVEAGLTLHWSRFVALRIDHLEQRLGCYGLNIQLGTFFDDPPQQMLWAGAACTLRLAPPKSCGGVFQRLGCRHRSSRLRRMRTTRSATELAGGSFLDVARRAEAAGKNLGDEVLVPNREPGVGHMHQRAECLAGRFRRLQKPG